MKKFILFLVCVVLIVTFAGSMGVITEFSQKKKDMIRLHVVGASNSEADQAVKLLVRDAVIDCVAEELNGCGCAEEAKAYLEESLSAIQLAAEKVLRENGFQSRVEVSFCEEAFPVRQYDTFALPSGVYRALRIRIGEAEGKNWWCVVFPSFCYGTSAEGFRDAAVGAGFSEPVTDTLSGKDGYKVSFFLLDLIGRVENFFHLG